MSIETDVGVIGKRTIDVVNDIFIMIFEFFDIFLHFEENSNFLHRSREERHPARQVDVQLSQVGRNSSRIVVETGSQDMICRSTSPSITFDTRSRSSSVLSDLTPLRRAEPVVVELEFRVQRGEIGRGEIWGGQMERGK